MHFYSPHKHNQTMCAVHHKRIKRRAIIRQKQLKMNRRTWKNVLDSNAHIRIWVRSFKICEDVFRMSIAMFTICNIVQYVFKSRFHCPITALSHSYIVSIRAYNVREFFLSYDMQDQYTQRLPPCGWFFPLIAHIRNRISAKRQCSSLKINSNTTYNNTQ